MERPKDWTTEQTHQLYTVKQVAEILKLSIAQTMKAIRDGRLKAHKVGWVWTISSTAIEDFRVENKINTL